MRTALVTGASRGIGKAIALRLAQDGFEVIVHCAGNIDKANAVAQEIRSRGGSAQVIAKDLTDIENIAPLCEKARDADVLVLNASLQHKKAWERISVKECHEQLNCNFVASMLLIQAAAENMRSKKWGRIITVGSVQEEKPHPDMLVYSASKAAQTNMVRSLSLQLAQDGITVNNVAPGVIHTDRNVESLSDPEYAKKVMASIPVGFYGQPEDVQGIVSLLCSDEGRYITGQSIFVDGGKSVQ